MKAIAMTAANSGEGKQENNLSLIARFTLFPLECVIVGI